MARADLSFDDVPALPDIESIVSRPGYQPSLYFSPKHKNRKFGKIIAPYHLKLAKIKCGIADCGTNHLHGYVITTSDGLETNIGKDCGTTHFKADFATEMKRHDELYNRRLKIHRILELKKVAPKLLEDILLAKHQYTSLKSLRYSLRSALTGTEDQALSHKLKSRDPGLYRYESRSLTEREAYFETNPDARKSGVVPPKQIKIGEIAGFDFLSATHRDEDVFGFINPLRNVISATPEDIYQWRTGQIDSHHKWIGTASKGLERVVYLIASGKAFFTEDNISGLGAAGISEATIVSLLGLAASPRL